MSDTKIQDYFNIIQQCPLFQNIPKVSLAAALEYLKARMQAFKKGEFIIHIGDAFQHADIVLKGTIECAFEDGNSNKLNMNHFSDGCLFGEALACANVSASPVQISAITDCIILFLDFRVLYDFKLKYEYQMQLAVNLINSFAKQNFFLNQKIRLLSRKSLRDRILFYLRSLAKNNDGVIILPFSQTAWAEFLCVNRSALSRELSRMAADGLLAMNGREFRLNAVP